MATVLAPRGQVSRRAILDAAARLFRRHGFAATSLRDIADAAGMKAGSLYYHFTSREEIVAEVLRIGIETVEAAVRRAVDRPHDATDPGVVLRLAIRAHLGALLTLGDYTSANVRIFGQVPPDVRRQSMPVRDRYDDLWRRILRDLDDRGVLRPRVDLDALRLFLIGAMNSALEWYRPGRKSIAQLADDLSDLVLHGVAHPAYRADPATPRKRRARR